MPRLSETGLQQYDKPGGQFAAWVNPKNIVGVPITIVHLGKKHVDDFYYPSGDFAAAHDEDVVGFTFDNHEDGYELIDEYIEGETYGFSTNAARIKSVLAKVDPEQHLPLEGVCILQDERGKYTQLYLGDSDSGDAATARESAPTRPTTSEPATHPAGSRNVQGREVASQAPNGNRPQPTSTGGTNRVDRRTTTARS